MVLKQSFFLQKLLPRVNFRQICQCKTISETTEVEKTTSAHKCPWVLFSPIWKSFTLQQKKNMRISNNSTLKLTENWRFFDRHRWCVLLLLLSTSPLSSHTPKTPYRLDFRQFQLIKFYKWLTKPAMCTNTSRLVFFMLLLAKTHLTCRFIFSSLVLCT